MALWDQSHDRARSPAYAAELIGRARDDLDPGSKAATLARAEELVNWLGQQSGVDAETIDELRRDLAASEPAGDAPTEPPSGC